MRTVLDLNSSFSIRLGKKNEIAELFSRNNPYTAGYDLSINSAGKAEMTCLTEPNSLLSRLLSFQQENGTTSVWYIDGSNSTGKMYMVDSWMLQNIK
jgi:hypothetical protein